MQRILALVVLLFVAVFMIGCSTAGPFVTNISPDGEGNLVVERSKVQFNSFTGTITNTEYSEKKIKIAP